VEELDALAFYYLASFCVVSTACARLERCDTGEFAQSWETVYLRSGKAANIVGLRVEHMAGKKAKTSIAKDACSLHENGRLFCIPQPTLKVGRGM
jgi:hypothetical protein